MATDPQLQAIYDELNKRGLYKSDPQMQAIGHEFRRRGLVTDPTQGGLMPQTPAPSPAPTQGPPELPSNFQGGAPVSMNFPKGVTAGPQVDFSGVHPEVSAAFQKALDEAKALGIPANVRVTSAARSREKQAQLYANRAQNKYPVAPPGKSLHEQGRAFDIDTSDEYRPHLTAVMERHGFKWGGHFKKPDPIHYEYTGAPIPPTPTPTATVTKPATKPAGAAYEPTLEPFKFTKSPEELAVAKAEQTWAQRPQFARAPGYRPVEKGPIKDLEAARFVSYGNFLRTFPQQQQDLLNKRNQLDQQRLKLEQAVAQSKVSPLNPSQAKALKQQRQIFDQNRKALMARSNELKSLYDKIQKTKREEFIGQDDLGRPYAYRREQIPIAGSFYPEEYQDKIGTLKPEAYSSVFGRVSPDRPILSFLTPLAADAVRRDLPAVRASMTWEGMMPRLPAIPYRGEEGRKRGIAEKNAAFDVVRAVGPALKDDGTVDPAALKQSGMAPAVAEGLLKTLNPWQRSLIPTIKQLIPAEERAFELAGVAKHLGIDLASSLAAEGAGALASRLIRSPATRGVVQRLAPQLMEWFTRAGAPTLKAEFSPLLAKESLQKIAIRSFPHFMAGAVTGGVAQAAAAATGTALLGAPLLEVAKAAVTAAPTGVALGGLSALIASGLGAGLRKTWNPDSSPKLIDRLVYEAQGRGLPEDHVPAFRERLTEYAQAPAYKKGSLLKAIRRDFGWVGTGKEPPAAPPPPREAAKPKTPTAGPTVTVDEKPINVRTTPVPALTETAGELTNRVQTGTASPADMTALATINAHINKHQQYDEQQKTPLPTEDINTEFKNKWNDPETEGRVHYDILENAADKVRNSNPELADKLSQAAHGLQKDFVHRFRSDLEQRGAIEPTGIVPTGPAEASTWRQLTPSEREELPENVRRILLVQDISNSKQVVDLATLPDTEFKDTVGKKLKPLEQYADELFNEAQSKYHTALSDAAAGVPSTALVPVEEAHQAYSDAVERNGYFSQAAQTARDRLNTLLQQTEQPALPAAEERPAPVEAPAPTEEKRVNKALRAKIEDLPAEEKDEAIRILREKILKHPVSSINSGAAYAIADKKPYQANIDMDGMKWVNDTYGHDAGDVVLKAAGASLKKALGEEAYHIHGDEFVGQGDSKKALADAVQAASEDLANKEIAIKDAKGNSKVIKGFGFSFGVGKDLATDAEAALQAHKAKRGVARGQALQEVIPAKTTAPIKAVPAKVELKVGSRFKSPSTDAVVEYVGPSETAGKIKIQIVDKGNTKFAVGKVLETSGADFTDRFKPTGVTSKIGKPGKVFLGKEQAGKKGGEAGTLVDRLFKRGAAKEPGKALPPGPPQPPGPPALPPKRDFGEFSDPETNELIEKNRAVDVRPSLKDRYLIARNRFFNIMTRTYEHIPHDDPRFAEFADLLRKVDKSGTSIAQDEAVIKLANALDGLNKKEYKVTSNAMFLHGMRDEIETQKAEWAARGKDPKLFEPLLPVDPSSGLRWTPKRLAQALMENEQDIASNPKIMDAISMLGYGRSKITGPYLTVIERVTGRKPQFGEGIYFHHKMIAYAAAKRLAAAGKLGFKARQFLNSAVNLGSLKKRQGSTLMYDTDLITSEMDWMPDMIYARMKLELLDHVQTKLDILKQLHREALDINDGQFVPYVDQIQTLWKKTVPKGQEGLLYRQKQDAAVKLTRLAHDDWLPDSPTGEWSSFLEDLKANHQFNEQRKTDFAYGFQQRINLSNSTLDTIPKYLEWLMEQDIVPGIVPKKHTEGSRASVKKQLSKEHVDADDLIPEGYRKWYGAPGTLLHDAWSEPEQLAMAIQRYGAEQMKMLPGEVKRVQSIVQRRQYLVIPNEVADTLNQIMARQPDSAAAFLLGALNLVQNQWKAAHLIFPTLAPGYWLGNFLGDLSNTIKAAPELTILQPTRFLKYAGNALSDLSRTMLLAKPPTPRLELYLAQGATSGLQTAAESIGTGTGIDILGKFTMRRIPLTLRFWNVLKNVVRVPHDLRELTLRFALFNYAMDHLEQHGTLPSFGMSRPKEVMAIKDPVRKAFNYSEDAIINYNRTSVGGQAIARYVYPFWRFQEGNAVSEGRLFRNAWQSPGFAAAVGNKWKQRLKMAGLIGVVRLMAMGRAALLAAAYGGTAYTLNKLFMGEDQDKYPEQYKYRPNIKFIDPLTGKPAVFDRGDNSLDMVAWVGLDNIGGYMDAYNRGLMTIPDIMLEMGVKTPINKFVGGMGPQYKLLLQAGGLAAFPSVFEPRKVRDPWEQLAAEFKLDGTYRYFKGRPQKPDSWLKIMTGAHLVDYGEAAYYEMRGFSHDWLAKQGKSKDFMGGESSDKASAVYWMKQSQRFSDSDSYNYFMLQAGLAGMTDKGFDSLILKLDPTGDMNVTDRAKFLDNLSSKDQDRIRNAYTYYVMHYAPSVDVADLVKESDLKEFVYGVRRAVKIAMKIEHPVRDLGDKDEALAEQQRQLMIEQIKNKSLSKIGR
jgi:diguanylate cyclase (GGDEF)-like protein